MIRGPEGSYFSFDILASSRGSAEDKERKKERKKTAATYQMIFFFLSRGRL
jgi:hypothetical protein